MTKFETIVSDQKTLACIIRAETNPLRTTFITPPESDLQVGFVVWPAGCAIERHVHRPLERHIVGTAEVIVVKRGLCSLDIYNENRELVATRELRPGDLALLLGGGHGFRMLKDTVLLEVKQGPYTGNQEKERF